jgi:hypothetical protein
MACNALLRARCAPCFPVLDFDMDWDVTRAKTLVLFLMHGRGRWRWSAGLDVRINIRLDTTRRDCLTLFRTGSILGLLDFYLWMRLGCSDSFLSSHFRFL